MPRAAKGQVDAVVPQAFPCEAVADAHRICDRIEAALENEVDGAQVIIHVEPEGEARPATAIRL